MTSQPQENVSCPVRMGKSLLKSSPGLPSADHPPAIVRRQTLTKHSVTDYGRLTIHTVLGAGEMDGGKACVLGVEENIAKEILFEQFGPGGGARHMFPLTRLEYRM